MPKTRILLLSCLVLGLTVPAAEANVRITGGEGKRLVVCGVQQSVRVAEQGQAVQAVVAPAVTRRGRAARRGSRVSVDRCEGGRWVRQRTTTLGVRRRALRTALPTGEAAIGDYRARILRRGRSAGKPAFLRVGVGEIVDTPVTFKVVNRNRTLLPCFGGPDGKSYEIKGSLVGPRSALTGSGNAAALYVHGLAYAEFFFRFKAVPGYDYGMEQAKAGHVSVVVDRLGYPQSRAESGNAICYSSQADIADQVVDSLRGGEYTTSGGRGPRFDRVALAGHSAGGFISEMAQYFFRTADALAVLGYNDTFPSPLVTQTLAGASVKCLTDQDRGDGASGPPGYAFFGETDQDYIRGHIHNADPAVVAEVLKVRTRDPCGDLISIGPSFVFNQPGIRSIQVPVLLAAGKQDALFPPPGEPAQALLGYPFAPNGDVDVEELENTGHAMTLGRTRDAFRAVMDRWLDDHGF